MRGLGPLLRQHIGAAPSVYHGVKGRAKPSNLVLKMEIAITDVLGRRSDLSAFIVHFTRKTDDGETARTYEAS